LVSEDVLSPIEAKEIHEIIGAFQYYARVIEATMLRAAADLLLDFAEGYQDAKMLYMQYRIYSDASYQLESESRSRAGGFHFLGEDTSATDTTAPNGAIFA
jgi:hypothetical protein